MTVKILPTRIFTAVCLLFCALATGGQSLPLHVQGRIAVNSVPHNSGAFFKFALVSGNTTLWSNDGTSVNGSEPSGLVPLAVSRGLWSVNLGDPGVTGMTQPIPPAIFANNDSVFLRIWFNDGSRGFQHLTPDQRISAVGYALNAQTADTAVNVTGPVPLNLLPAGVIVNNGSGVNLTGTFTGNGAGLTGVPGSVPWQVVTGRSVQSGAQQGYLVLSQEGTTVRLPATPAVGDVIRVSGPNAGGWRILQNGSQTIKGAFTSEIGAVWAARANARNWTSIAMSSDGTRLIGTVRDGSIWTSTDFGVNWVPHAEVGQRLFGAAASSGDGGTLIAASTNNYIYVSMDSGLTWRERTLPGLANWSAVASSLAGSNLVATVNGGFIFTSADSGETWASRAVSRSWQGVASSATGTNLFAVAANDFVYKSVNAGVNWSPIAAAGQRAWRAIAVSTNTTRVIAAALGGAVYISPDSGVNWNAVAALTAGAWSCVASSEDGSILAAAKVGGKIHVSTDSGATWTPQEADRSWTSVAMSANGRRLAATVLNGNVFVSEPSPLGGTTPGANGYLTGGSYSAVELQYIGGDIFFPISSAGTILAH